MTAPLRFIQVGTGGFGAYWCRTVFPSLMEAGRAEVVAAVDIVADNLANARLHLGISEERCYTDLDRALSEREADAIAIIVPPAHHEAVVDKALAHGLHILSEKPIADSMDASWRIARKVHEAGRLMAVTMSHRFDQDKQSLEAEVHSGRHGRPDYVVHRFSHACRAFGSWGEFRHRIPDPLLIEGTIHHFDIHRALTRSNAKTVYARTWNPEWAEYAGDSMGLLIIEMLNGMHVQYEGAKANATTLNGWGEDYLRVECQDATLELDQRRLRLLRNGEEGRPVAEELPLLDQPLWTNPWLASMFCDWVEGRIESHPTQVSDNLQCTALLFAAVESAHTGQAVDVQEFLARDAPPGLLSEVVGAPLIGSIPIAHDGSLPRQ